MVATHGDAIKSKKHSRRSSGRGFAGGPLAVCSPSYRPAAAALASAFPSAGVYTSASPALDAKGAAAAAKALVDLLGGPAATSGAFAPRVGAPPPDYAALFIDACVIRA